nr:interleukin-9 receptor isoform X2 [Microcebus murinus]
MLESEALRRDVATWFLTCMCICTCVCLGASVPGQGGGPRAGTFTCLTNNILRIDCHWSAPELGQGSSPWLLFTNNQAPGGAYKCVFQGSECTVVLPPEGVLVPSDNFTITFHRRVAGKELVSLVDPQYLPRRHGEQGRCRPAVEALAGTSRLPGGLGRALQPVTVWPIKLDPPSDLQSNVSSGYCVLTWSINPALEPMATLLSYELAFKRQEEAWEWARHKDHIIGVTWLSLEATELDPGFTYEARLRVQMATLEDDVAEGEHYAGQWSEWSQPVCFPSPQRQAPLIPPWGRPDSTFVAVSIFLLLTGLTYLLFKLSPRPGRGPIEPVCSGARTAPRKGPWSPVSRRPLHCLPLASSPWAWRRRRRALGPWGPGVPRTCYQQGVQRWEDSHLPTCLRMTGPTCPPPGWLPQSQRAAAATTVPWAAMRGPTPGPSQAIPRALGPSEPWPVAFPVTNRTSGPGKVAAGHCQRHGYMRDSSVLCSLLSLAGSRLSPENSRTLTRSATSCPFWGK